MIYSILTIAFILTALFTILAYFLWKQELKKDDFPEVKVEITESKGKFTWTIYDEEEPVDTGTTTDIRQAVKEVLSAIPEEGGTSRIFG